MIPGIWVFKGVLQRVCFLCFLGSSAKSLQSVQKIGRKASESLKIQWEISLPPKKTNGFQRESSKVDRNCAKSVKNCGICQNIIAESWGRTPPRCNILTDSAFFHTFCLLLNLFWTFPLKSIGFLRFQLIFRWFFNDFSGFSADFLDIFQRLCKRPKKT